MGIQLPALRGKPHSPTGVLVSVLEWWTEWRSVRWHTLPNVPWIQSHELIRWSISQRAWEEWKRLWESGVNVAWYSQTGRIVKLRWGAIWVILRYIGKMWRHSETRGRERCSFQAGHHRGSTLRVDFAHHAVELVMS